MTIIYIENTVKSHAVKLWRHIKSPFSLDNILKNNTIDFNKFREIMAIDLLDPYMKRLDCNMEWVNLKKVIMFGMK